MSGTSIIPLLAEARKASKHVNILSDEKRRVITLAIAEAILANIPHILEANNVDLSQMEATDPRYDRLLLDKHRLQAIAEATRQVAELPDPVGRVLSTYHKPNGLDITKITTPLGVVGAIYEARPNVTIDISALCLRSGNGVVLKGGSEAAETNACIVDVIQEVLVDHDLFPEAVTLLPNDREQMQTFLTAVDFIDVLIPRGSQGLINFVRQHATVPTIETGAGVCHTYVERTADLAMAAAIVVNAKTQRPAVCNALDTILVDRAVAAAFLPMLKPGFKPFMVGIYADDEAWDILHAARYPWLDHARFQNFGREYLSQNCSVKVVEDLDEALEHIAEFGSRHSEAIVTNHPASAERFLTEVDAAAVYHNASTRFTDGGEFGLGAEMGISTQKLHARGPFALEKLVCEKWVVRGSGQVR
jgi:glutamate-5-semialdehyde dehydrogenase